MAYSPFYNPYQSQIYPNNYYNPYNQQYPNMSTNTYQNALQQQPVQTVTEPTIAQGIYGKIVESFDSITANDVPMSGAAFFVKNDRSEIQMRSWNSGGTIDIITYKTTPTEQKNNDAGNLTNQNAVFDMDAILQATDTFMKRLDDIDSKLDMISKPSNDRRNNRSQKED